jgi:hypothetical protein
MIETGNTLFLMTGRAFVLAALLLFAVALVAALRHSGGSAGSSGG